MANNRPINRRPWRRRPWRKTRRPASWHDAFSTGLAASGNPGFPWAQLTPPSAGQALSTLREIMAGDVDAVYLDREEVRVDRIVGDITFWTASATDGVLAQPPVVRMGLIVEEDPAERTATIDADTYSLWSPTALGNLEWMYLEQPMWAASLGPRGAESDPQQGVREFYAHSHLDIRVKRKLGKADRLWLVMSYGNGFAADAGVTSNNWLSEVYEAHMLRCVLVA